MEATRLAQSYRDLEVYKACFRFQQAVFEATRGCPKGETFSITDCDCDCDSELQETTRWLRTAYACAYLNEGMCMDFIKQAEEIGKMLGAMIANHHVFCTATPSRSSFSPPPTN